MSDHCPGFENNKSLSEVLLTCPDCKATIEISSDEMEKLHKCKACNAIVDPKKCQKEG